MGKKSKTGKQRKDKFYHLAKETGYRARSAFKLIQLNRKFGFLQESRVLVDLCAAPGGWLQVAAENMPVSSIVIGIDLVAIKPIQNVTTFQADITTDHCRQQLKKELKTWKVDVVLNDGAPNVGTAWVQDAFSQAQLALSALKLASEHLRKDGWFITKLFRSKDYTAILWVFQQLFKKVHSTKPQASRNESAEIFVVCQGFLAPDKLDDKFLDPKYVFKEIEQDSKVRLDILRPEKQVRQREGYPENNITLHSTITAQEFIDTTDAVSLLSSTNKIDIVAEKIKNHSTTTSEIILCCQDIKVLGRKEIKLLFSWRKKLRKEFKVDIQEPLKEPVGAANETEKTEEEKQEELDHMISEVKEQEGKDAKKKKKRVREAKKKLRERLANKLEAATDDAGIQEQDLFALNLMSNKKDLDVVGNADADEIARDENESELEFESEDENSDSNCDEDYVYGDDELYEKPVKKKQQIEEPVKMKKKNIGKSDNPLLVDMEEEGNDEAVAAVKRAKQWFQRDIFKGVEDKKNVDDDLDDDYDFEQMLRNHKQKGGTVIERVQNEDTNDENKSDGIAREDKSDGEDEEKNDNEYVNNDDSEDDDEDDEAESDSDYESEIDDRSISQGRSNINEKPEPTVANSEVGNKRKIELGPEDLALGAAMVTSKKRKRDIIDAAFNRYTFNDQNLPSWFIEDENKHNIRQMPITREEVEVYKQRMRALNARPIKKVIEAKAKKKSKMLSKLDRARKKAQGILDATETSSKEKQEQIKGIYKKAGLLKKKNTKPTYVVAKKSLAGKRYKRPDNVKGTFKVVDPRMKKDLKAMKNKEKTKGRKGRKK